MPINYQRPLGILRSSSLCLLFIPKLPTCISCTFSWTVQITHSQKASEEFNNFIYHFIYHNTPYASPLPIKIEYSAPTIIFTKIFLLECSQARSNNLFLGKAFQYMSLLCASNTSIYAHLKPTVCCQTMWSCSL